MQFADVACALKTQTAIILVSDRGGGLVPIAIHDGVSEVSVTVVRIVHNYDFIPHCFATTKVYVTQGFAFVECARVNFLYTRRDINILKRYTALKQLRINYRDAFRQSDFLQRCAIPENNIFYFRHLPWKHYSGKCNAVIKSAFSDNFHTIRNGNIAQIFTVRECTVLDFRHSCRNYDSTQRCTVSESIGSNFRYRIRYLNIA